MHLKALPLVLAGSLAASAAAQSVATFAYSARVTSVSDPLGLFDGVSAGSDSGGQFAFDTALLANSPLAPGNPGGIVSLFIANQLGAALADGSSFDIETPVVLVFDDVAGSIEGPLGGPIVTDDGLYDTVVVGGAITDLPPGTNYGSVEIVFEGVSSWYDDAGLPATATLGLENLLRAEVIIEFQRFGGSFDPNDPSSINPDDLELSRVRLEITAVSRDGGTIATIGCRPAQLSAPVAVLDFGDVNAFVNAFRAGGTSADLNGDQIIGFDDVAAFVTAFNGGCN
jgi:hypothetical protein